MNRTFFRHKGGAITTDWIALSGSVVMIVLMLAYGMLDKSDPEDAPLKRGHFVNAGVDGTYRPANANGGATPTVCRKDICLYDTDKDGMYDSQGHYDWSVVQPIVGQQISPAKAKAEGFVPRG